MSTFSQIAWGFFPLVVLIMVWRAKAELRKERAKAKSTFIQDKNEFMSIWMLAQEWTGVQAESRDPIDVPDPVRRQVDKLILAYFRKELSLRARDGYALAGHRWFEEFFGLDHDF